MSTSTEIDRVIKGFYCNSYSLKDGLGWLIMCSTMIIKHVLSFVHRPLRHRAGCEGLWSPQAALPVVHCCPGKLGLSGGTVRSTHTPHGDAPGEQLLLRAGAHLWYGHCYTGTIGYCNTWRCEREGRAAYGIYIIIHSKNLSFELCLLKVRWWVLLMTSDWITFSFILSGRNPPRNIYQVNNRNNAILMKLKTRRVIIVNNFEPDARHIHIIMRNRFCKMHRLCTMTSWLLAFNTKLHKAGLNINFHILKIFISPILG